MARSKYIIEVVDREGEFEKKFMHRGNKTFQLGKIKEASRMSEATAKAWVATMRTYKTFAARCTITARKITDAEIEFCNRDFFHDARVAAQSNAQRRAAQ